MLERAEHPAVRNLHSPKGASFQTNLGLGCSKPEGQGLSNESRWGLFGKTEANGACLLAIVGKFERSTFFLQALASA